MANPDPAIHTQSRFGGLLGHDGTFVSHIEAGRRPIPPDLRDRWLQLIGLDGGGLQRYLASVDARTHPVLSSPPYGQAQSQADFDLVDRALEGESLTPQQWARACDAAVTLRLPRTVRRFCRRAADAMSVCSSAEYRVMVTALAHLPGQAVTEAVRESVEASPTRGYHAIQILGELDGSLSGPVLRYFFRDLPDPWLERSLAESMRRVVSRGEVTTLVDDPSALQRSLVEGLGEASSWTSRIELANLAWALGPMPAQLQERVINESDADVRLVAHPALSESAQAAVSALREQAVASTLDKMYGSPVEDPLADRLAGLMITGRTRRARIHAAEALALSPYSDRVAGVLGSLTRAPAVEVRRAATQALQSFPTTPDVVASLTAAAQRDSDPSVRGRALGSLVFHSDGLPQEVLDTVIRDHDPEVRRSAVDLAHAAGNTPALRTAMADADPAIARHARLLDPAQITI
ncbi:HEAT repeat domain-containing protein [Kutzneria buriramensis]|nr:HEAT repeat domain-containing protein [Kutzneria buriramensis]